MKHYRLIILGAGTGGIVMAARMRRFFAPGQIAVIDGSEFHYFQPHWSLAAAGLVKAKSTRKPISAVLPKGVDHVQSMVSGLDPIKQKITVTGAEFTYDFLIIATGLQLDWHKIKGIDGQLGKNGICTSYTFDGLEQTRKMLSSFKGGNAVFIMPEMPIKCPGAPQKIMYLADQIFRENGVRERTDVIYASDSESIFSVEDCLATLNEVIRRKQIETRYNYRLIEIDPVKKIAHFERHIQVPGLGGKTAQKEIPTEIPFDLLHVVPPQSAHVFLQEADLTWKQGEHKGWLKVDNTTLQHMDYANIFGIGDVTGISSTKTASAIRKQAPIVQRNLVAAIKKQQLPAKYDGTSTCPMETDRKSAILVRLQFGKELIRPTKERYIFWLFKRYLLPWMYWHFLLKGF